MGFKNRVFDHETRTSGLFPCYRLKIYDFLSSYNPNLKIDIFTPLQQIPCYCKSRLGTLRLISWWRVTYVCKFPLSARKNPHREYLIEHVLIVQGKVAPFSITLIHMSQYMQLLLSQLQVRLLLLLLLLLLLVSPSFS